MDTSLCSSLITWVRTFPGHDDVTAPSLTDGVAMGTILHQIAPEYFTKQWLSKIRTDVADNWRLKVSNLKKIYEGVMDYFSFSDLAAQNIHQLSTSDLNKIVEHDDEMELGRLLQLILGCAINCEQKQKHIEAIMGMEEGVQALLMTAIKDLINRESSPGPPEMGPTSFHPHVKTLMEQLEAMAGAKEEMANRCNELDLQITILNEEKKGIEEDKNKLAERIEVLESGGDIGAQSSRCKDLRKQVETLQDELYKVESSRDEYRSRVEGLNRENIDVTTRNEELQRLADESRSLKDEVDALRDMSERVAVYEGTVETYKKKLEELSDLKRQVKILEEKNSDYMQQNMELEEEVKKSGTWRPQLDLYKKQVSELHQKLADEAKKADRQIFENKKLMEKLEALTQEKDRLALEKDMLRENVDELKCTVSALSSPDTASRPPSDLSDLDTLEIIPPEIREKLVRLQHENRVLKQKASDKCDESTPMLQSLLNDLQERYDKLLQENRWEKFSPPSPPSYHHPQWPPFGRMWPLDAYLMLDSPTRNPTKKLKVLKRNLKWASESDLLILRQPQHTSSLSSFFSHKRGRPSPKSLTLPSTATAVSPPKSEGNPIVIHHIHEFKMAPSPTNEDSGCCRTSPSSCEGCEDQRSASGSYGIRTPEYGNTLDSGVSGMFRCLSPVIPSIVEECTTHHMSDILPAILNQEGTSGAPPVMYHSHPSHHLTTHSHNNQPAHPATSHTQCNCFYCSASSKSSCEVTPDTILSKTEPNAFPSLPFTTISNSGTQDSKCNERETNFKSSVASDQHNLLRIDSATQTSQADSSIPGRANKQSASLPQRPDPPDSPTPHNSPRLPHSIHSNRSKGGKSSVALNCTSSSQESPTIQTSSIPTFSNIERMVERKGSIATCEDVKREPKSRAILSKPPHNSNPEQTNQRLTSPKPYLETDLDKAFPNRFRASFRETNLDKFTVKLKSGILKVRSKSLDKHRSNPETKLSIHDDSLQPSSGKHLSSTDVRSPPRESLKSSKPITRLSDNKMDSRVERMRYAGRSSVPSPSSAKTSDSPSSQADKENNRRSWGFENSQLYKSLRDNKFLSIPSSISSESKRRSRSETPSLKLAVAPQPSSNPPRVRDLSAGNCDSNSPSPSALTLSKNQNESRKKSRTCSSSSKSCKPSVGANAPSDANSRRPPSSRESLTAFRAPSSSPSKKSDKSPEVTLLTDTLFTHFVVTPKKKPSLNVSSSKYRSGSIPSMSSVHSLPAPVLCSSTPHRRSRASEPLLSDTDTDIELLENRLMSSAYGAPLVSSESSTSIQQSDNNTDLDPSATDYFTETEADDFNPRQYKLLTLEDRRLPIPVARRASEAVWTRPLGDEMPLVPPSSPRPVVVTQSNNYFKKKNHQVVPASKAKVLNGGIVKLKNKTAKAVVAETFNAVFTFCTP